MELDYRHIHKKCMLISWIYLINIIVILGTFNSSKTAVLIHSIGGFLITLLSFLITIPFVSEQVDHLDSNQFTFYFHIIFGVLCGCAMIFQIIHGILILFLNFIGGKSILILNIKRLHMVSGILILIMVKVQIYEVRSSEKTTVPLIFDIISLIFYCYRKFGVSQLVYQPVNAYKSQPVTPLAMVTSLKSMRNENSKLYIYRNHVYDLTNIVQWHPAGFQILQSVKGSELEKYMFGIYSPNKHLSIKVHPHSNQSLRMLDSPIAKLAIPSTFQNLSPANRVTVSEMKLLYHLSNVYEVHLKKDQLVFQGYRDIKQLGRYYCLTIDNKITRLYTVVNFLDWKNIMLLKQYLHSSSHLEKYYEERICHSQSIPILFRQYLNGKFTNQFVTGKHELSISDEQGLGFQLDEIGAGEIVILAGGTGIFPFLDLFDLLYKRHLIDQRPNLSKTFAHDNPLLSNNIFAKFSFRVYASFQHIEQIHPIILQQLKQLSSTNKLKVILHAKPSFGQFSCPEFTFTQQRFQQIAINLCQQAKSISKIFVCGPSRMNQSLSFILRQNLDENKYFIL